MPAYTKGEGQQQGAAGPSQLHEDATPVVHLPWGDWTPNGPVAPHPAFADHDHVPTTPGEMLAQAQAQVSKAKLANETPEQRAKDEAGIDAGSRLVALSRNMNDKNSKAFIAQLDSMNDPELRHKAMAEFEAETGQKLDAFINGCNDWNNNGDRRDKTAALQLISEERDKADDDIAKMSPQEREAKRQEIAKEAAELNDLTSKRDHSDENSQKIFRLLEGKSPAEIEMLRDAVRTDSKGHFNLYERIDYGMHKGDEDEAVMMLSGSKVDKVRAALCNEDDPKRLVEVVGNLHSKEELEEINREPFKSMALSRIKNPSDRAVLAAALEGNSDLAKGERIGNLLEPKDEGMTRDAYGMYDEASRDNYDRRKAGNVVREFESMSPEECKAAVAAYDAAHGAGAMEKLLEARWGNDEDQTEHDRIKAMMEGDKGKDRSLRFQESMREEDKDEREAALQHEKVSEADLHSKDEKVRKHAEAVQRENESFERNNVEADHDRRVAVNMLTGRHDDTTGHSSKAQVNDYMAMQAAKDTTPTYQENALRYAGDDVGADIQHISDRAKHIKEVGEDRIAAMELLDDGKLSPETEFHRGKGTKEKAEALENITSGKDLEAAQKAYKEKYGEDMLPPTKTARSDMNANELMIDNVRLYGVRAERPAQLEILLQKQQVKVQYSASLEYDEDGAGTQAYQRILLEKMDDTQKDPKLAVHGPKIVTEVDGQELPWPQLVEDPNDPKFEDYQGSIDKLVRDAPDGDIHKIDDGFKEGVKKSDFAALDKHLVEVNKSQEEAKKALAERFIKVFSMIAKIAAVLTANPWLIAAIDIAEGLVEMGIKHSVMGEAYDPGEDLKMLAVTAVADVALVGFSKLGELKGAAKVAEAEALAEKGVMEAEHAATAEAKAEVVKEGAHAMAGESKALEGAIEEAGSIEKAGASEAASKIESKAADMAEGKALHEGESAAAKTAETEAKEGAVKAGEEGAMTAEEAAEKIKARYGMYGGAAKMATQTVGGGIVQHKSPSDILKGLVTGGLGLVLPGHLAERAKAAIGNSTLAAKVLGEIASFGTEVTTNTTISVAGGAEGGDALFDSALGAGGSRAQHLYAGGHAAPKHEDEERTTGREEPAREENTSKGDGGVAVVGGALEEVTTNSKPTTDPLAEPRAWAAEQQRIANQREKLSPKQKEALEVIKDLRQNARTHEDWETLRKFEDEHDIPVTMRTSPHDEQAALDAMRVEKSFGKHADGTPVTAEEHAAAVEETQRDDVNPATKAHDDEYAELVESVRSDAEGKYRRRDDELAGQVKGEDTIRGDEATIGLGLAGTGAAMANPKTRQVDEHGMSRNIGLGQDDKPEIWGTMPQQEEIGQPAGSLDRGLPGLGKIAEHATAQNARAGEVAAAVAENRAASGIASLEVAGPLAPLEARGAQYRVNPETGKPELVSLGAISTTARVKVGVVDGKPVYETKTIEMENGFDFMGGMGPARDLTDVNPRTGLRAMTKEELEVMSGSPSIEQARKDLEAGSITRKEFDDRVAKARMVISAEDALTLPASAFADQNVLVIGGGPTSKWAGDHAMSGMRDEAGNIHGSVEIAGSMPRPAKGTKEAAEFKAKEAEIAAALKGDKKTPEDLAKLRDEYHAMVKKHIAREMAEMKQLEQAAAAGMLSPTEQRRLEGLKGDLDPFMGSRVDRNESSLNDPDISHLQMDVANVTKSPDGKALVTYVDGTQRVYDRVIPGIGAAAEKPGGLVNMLSQLPPEMKLLPVIEDGRPVGLISDPPGIRISGAAAFGTTGKLPDEVLVRMPAEYRNLYEFSVKEWANRQGVSHGSKGIVPGIENVGDTGAKMQIAKERSPEERQQLLEEWAARTNLKVNRIADYTNPSWWDQPVMLRDTL